MNIKKQIVDEITRQIGNRRQREANVLSALDAVADEVEALQTFYIGSDDPGAHGNPGLVLYRTLTQEERALAKAEGSHNAGEPWSVWLTDDVLAVAEASGLLDEANGTSAASARKWLQEDAKADQIRKQIAYLEGELSRISGEPLVIWDGRGRLADLPDGGATLEWSPPAGTGFLKWYPTTDAARAALLAFAREHGCVPEADGWRVDISAETAQFSSDAWVTRRDQAKLPTLWVVNPMLDIRNTVDVYRDREKALDRCDDIERRHPGVRVSPVRVKPGDPSYERHAAVAE